MVALCLLMPVAVPAELTCVSLWAGLWQVEAEGRAQGFGTFLARTTRTWFRIPVAFIFVNSVHVCVGVVWANLVNPASEGDCTHHCRA